ncbi:MAG: hypothetical protein WD898_00555 [Candidatus Paceibacterota bacterium]
MKLEVKKRIGESLGVIEFDDRNQFNFSEGTKNSFKDYVSQLIEKGIDQIKDIYDKEAAAFTMIKVPIHRDASQFPLAFKELLEREGYDVTIIREDLDKEILNSLKDFPPDKSKDNILSRLPKMSYLEKTYILKGLNDLNKNV